jgi:hypothetical protein
VGGTHCRTAWVPALSGIKNSKPFPCAQCLRDIGADTQGMRLYLVRHLTIHTLREINDFQFNKLSNWHGDC